MQLYYKLYPERIRSSISSFIRVNFCRQANSFLAKCIQIYCLLSKHNFPILFGSSIWPLMRYRREQTHGLCGCRLDEVLWQESSQLECIDLKIKLDDFQGWKVGKVIKNINSMFAFPYVLS